MALIGQDLEKLHNCLGKKRKHLEILDFQIATSRAEDLILEQSIQFKRETLEDLANQEKKIKRNLTAAGRFKNVSEQISDIEVTAEYTQDQMEDMAEGLSSLKDEIEELQGVVEKAKKKTRKATM